MVKSETLFCRLIGIDTLFSFDGIIPSAEDFQLRLTTLIEQLNKALLAENQDDGESESLCRALCCYFDQRLTSEHQNNSLSWQRYSLVNYFYGYNEAQLMPPLSTQLDTLLSSNSEVIFRYAWKLLTLLTQIEGKTEALVSLRTTHRARYSSRVQTVSATDNKIASWVTPRPVTEGAPGLIVFIIGPFASKWFNQSDFSSSGDNGIVWIVAEHASTLISRLTHVETQHEGIATMAFFPLLADGAENNGVMVEQITAWQYAFSSIRLPHHLPCFLGIYNQLSQQRYLHDPDRAIWIGGLDESPKTHLKLETRLADLVDELGARDDGNDLYAIQRHALGNTLVTWLAENRIMNALQNLFDDTQLDLAGVALADHGQGFTRHGAWSHWLAERYGILPGLSASIALPPLPDIQLPPVTEPEPTPPPKIAAAPVSTPRWNWPPIAALAVVIACLLGGFWHYGKRHFGPLKERATEMFTLSDTVPLFENGSSKLMPDNEKVLMELVPKMVRLPQQRFLIIGHSDNTGSAAVNLALSTERARVIRDWLVEHTGLPASNFIVEGAGNTRPIASNDTQEGRAQNRRVEIIPLSLQSNKD
ncbi:OmpA family protein [Erwinia sp. CPCC 100877]|nr:OmpA family protein [Erwinia sp. CPCC 100877]